MTEAERKKLMGGRKASPAITLDELKEILSDRKAASKPACFSVEEAADMLGVGRAYTFRLIKEGILASIRLGRRRLVPQVAIDALIAARMK